MGVLYLEIADTVFENLVVITNCKYNTEQIKKNCCGIRAGQDISGAPIEIFSVTSTNADFVFSVLIPLNSACLKCTH